MPVTSSIRDECGYHLHRNTPGNWPVPAATVQLSFAANLGPLFAPKDCGNLGRFYFYETLSPFLLGRALELGLDLLLGSDVRGLLGADP